VAQSKTASKSNRKRVLSTKSTKKAAGARRTRPGATKLSSDKSPAPVGDDEVTIDRRRGARRNENGESTSTAPHAAVKLERRQKVNRRRQIDPTTCERDYTEDEVEFMNALDDYKRKSGRMFPTCSEVLEVLRSLGYVKLSQSELASRPDAATAHVSAKPMSSEPGAPAADSIGRTSELASL
jgi:hypothetical protein